MADDLIFDLKIFQQLKTLAVRGSTQYDFGQLANPSGILWIILLKLIQINWRTQKSLDAMKSRILLQVKLGDDRQHCRAIGETDKISTSASVNRASHFLWIFA